MNSLLDLNITANIAYAQQSSYAIVYGNSAGNATISSTASGNFAPPKQVAITTLTDAVRDVLIDFTVANINTAAKISSVSYNGNFGNIGVLQINDIQWRVFGVRTIGRYDEAFANIRITNTNTATSYSFVTTVNDQSGNTRTWNNTVTI